MSVSISRAMLRFASLTDGELVEAPVQLVPAWNAVDLALLLGSALQGLHVVFELGE